MEGRSALMPVQTNRVDCGKFHMLYVGGAHLFFSPAAVVAVVLGGVSGVFMVAVLSWLEQSQ